MLLRDRRRLDFVEQAAGAATWSPQDLREMGQRARQSACAMGWDRIVEQIESMFIATLNDGPLARHSPLLQSQVPAR